MDKSNNNQIKMEPFLKWAGGKRWLVENHPDFFNIGFNKYIEPFLGSGAVFFYLQPKRAILSDSNIQLINTYNAIKYDWKSVFSELKKHHKKHSHEYYYSVREKTLRKDSTRAAQFIYLNRTCWNGLYRVNMNGKFNVPIGTKSSVIFDYDNFEEISRYLQRANVYQGDFEKTIKKTKKGDLIFADPPYTVKHKHNGFIKYNEDLFSWNDQIRLFEALVLAKERGAIVISTNADHKSIRDLYSTP